MERARRALSHHSAPPSDCARPARLKVEGQEGGGRLTTSGFTLLETLIALCVLGLILSAVYGSYRAVTSSIANLAPKIALDQKGRFFVQRLSRQIRCCYGGRVGQGKRPPSIQKDAKPAAGLEGIHFFRGGPTPSDDAVLQFVTTSSTLSRASNVGCLAVVSYKMDPSQHVLLACEEVYGRPGKDDDKNWRVVLEDLREIEFRYFDGVAWQTQWDSSVAGGLPRAVRIRLVLESDQDGVPRSFASVVPIRCSTPARLDTEIQKPPRADENRDKRVEGL